MSLFEICKSGPKPALIGQEPLPRSVGVTFSAFIGTTGNLIQRMRVTPPSDSTLMSSGSVRASKCGLGTCKRSRQAGSIK